MEPVVHVRAPSDRTAEFSPLACVPGYPWCVDESVSWCWVDASGVYRLANTEELRSAIVDATVATDVLVWREGMAAFAPATLFSEFFSAAKQRAACGLTPESAGGDPPGKVITPTFEMAQALSQATEEKTLRLVAASKRPAPPRPAAQEVPDELPTIPMRPGAVLDAGRRTQEPSAADGPTVEDGPTVDDEPAVEDGPTVDDAPSASTARPIPRPGPESPNATAKTRPPRPPPPPAPTPTAPVAVAKPPEAARPLADAAAPKKISLHPPAAPSLRTPSPASAESKAPDAARAPTAAAPSVTESVAAADAAAPKRSSLRLPPPPSLRTPAPAASAPESAHPAQGARASAATDSAAAKKAPLRPPPPPSTRTPAPAAPSAQPASQPPPTASAAPQTPRKAAVRPVPPRPSGQEPPAAASVKTVSSHPPGPGETNQVSEPQKPPAPAADVRPMAPGLPASGSAEAAANGADLSAATKQDRSSITDSTRPFRGVSAQFFQQGEDVSARWQQEQGQAPQPQEEVPGPELDVHSVGLWQSIVLRVRHERWFWPAVAGLGLVVLVGMVGFVATLFRAGSKQLGAQAASSGSAEDRVDRQGSAPHDSALTGAAAGSTSTSAAACTLANAPQRVAPAAIKDVQPEAWVSPDGLRFAVGFSVPVRKAAGLVLDLPSLRTQNTFSKPAASLIRHVVPVASGTEVTFAVDEDDGMARVKGAFTVSAGGLIKIGWTKDALAAWPQGSASTSPLWPRMAGGKGDAVRAVAVESAGMAISFRMGDTIWLGWADSANKPKGALFRVQGTGVKVGPPSIAWNGSELLVAFADMTDPNGPWQIRAARAHWGEPPSASEPWIAPKGGPGKTATEPNVSAVDEHRWLMVWSEGEPRVRVIRAQTCDTRMRPVGAAFDISPQGAGPSNPVAATRNSHGAVAYYAGGGFVPQVWAAAVSCP
jgi:hypothetical protein